MNSITVLRRRCVFVLGFGRQLVVAVVAVVGRHVIVVIVVVVVLLLSLLRCWLRLVVPFLRFLRCSL